MEPDIISVITGQPLCPSEKAPSIFTRKSETSTHRTVVNAGIYDSRLSVDREIIDKIRAIRLELQAREKEFTELGKR